MRISVFASTDLYRFTVLPSSCITCFQGFVPLRLGYKNGFFGHFGHFRQSGSGEHAQLFNDLYYFVVV